jgi:hypothetical protein
MKVSKRTNRICLGLAIAALVAIFCYQVAYATNESDYRHGFKAGLWAYYECRNQSSCRPTLPEQVNTVVTTGIIDGHPGGVTVSQTPYAHGYHHGWVHACLNDGGWANCYGWHDGGPVIAAITGPGHCYNTTKEGETCESGPMIPIH